MTISVAWVRKAGTQEELVVATDSRLSFGCKWDCSPKVGAMPRGDSILCFAGDTLYAYPILLQALAAVSQHPKLLSRAMDLMDLKGHLLRILNSMTLLVHDLPAGGPSEPDTTFIFAGWSWRRGMFIAWLLHYDAHIRKFTFRPARAWTGPNRAKYICATGDYQVEFKRRLVELLRKKRKLRAGAFDMEPFEVLRDMLRCDSFHLIGGAPQLMKIYKHQNCRPFGVFWPSYESKRVNLLGRPLLDYESSDYLVLDPDSLQTTKHVDVK